jgi:imidazole glycerol-phosphate synthase subunit HisF
MARKRLIYTLLYADGGFMLSRNFRLQRAGDVHWLLKNYHFEKVASCIDELLIIDVSRKSYNRDAFLSAVRSVVEGCFIPVALGGGIQDFETAAAFIESGADKIVVNSIFDINPSVVQQIASVYGSQCVIGGIDLRRSSTGSLEVLSQQGGISLGITPAERIDLMLKNGAGEILVQSVDRDGTGFGLDLSLVLAVGAPLSAPLIICGGCGKGAHMIEAFDRVEIDAVATANLFNFIGDGLLKARDELIGSGLDLAVWRSDDVLALRNSMVAACAF